MFKKICVALFMSFIAGTSAICLVSSTIVLPAYSQNNETINYFRDGYRKAFSGWNNLDSSEREIDRRIAAALERIGRRSIPVTDNNLIWMMQTINVSRDLRTAGFVAGRMSFYAQTTQTLNQTDNLLCSIGTQFNISAGTAYCP
jgi:hypothetical protein